MMEAIAEAVDLTEAPEDALCSLVIDLQQNTASSKPLEDFIRQFSGNCSTGNGDPLERAATTGKAGSR